MTAASTGVARLALGVGLLASAMLLLELMLTRIFSVLFFYHYSFFAISLVMAGLALGGLAAARYDAVRRDDEQLFRTLAELAVGFSSLTLVALVFLTMGGALPDEVSLLQVAVQALVFLPGLVAGGAFLAIAFAARDAWISRLYAADLVAAALACGAAILLMRLLQGFTMLLAPAALGSAAALVLAPRKTVVRAFAVFFVTVSSLLSVLSLAPLRGSDLPSEGAGILFEKWNEHSRVVMYAGETSEKRYLVIDRSAGTHMSRIPAGADGYPAIDPSWLQSTRAFAYLLANRPPARVAIIGVGGGEDLLAPLAAGAVRVDGIELNEILVELLRTGASDFNRIADRPEVNLVHAEARVALSRSREEYDVIQASLVDTWAATASGGFVLSENGLYTIEGWATFLRALRPSGILSMTRWLLEEDPAEVQRLVSLAVSSLARVGIESPSDHIVVISHDRRRDVESLSQATILVSSTPFSPSELDRLVAEARSRGADLLVGPGHRSEDPVIGQLMDPRSRMRAIQESRYDLTAPTDARPYFFLQLKPSSVLGFEGPGVTSVTEITFAGVRVLLLLVALSLAFAGAVAILAAITLPGPRRDGHLRRTYRWMVPYFTGIGFGYVLIQLGLHQRLIILLGHPTLALSVLLFWMLLGTGVGAWLSGRFDLDQAPIAWGLILAALLLSVLVYPVLGVLEAVGPAARAVAVGVLVFGTGLVLGFGFPLGVRIVAPTGPWSVQKVWAVNGAASIAGASLAAIVGVLWGSRLVIVAGLTAYALGILCGWRALLLTENRQPDLHPDVRQPLGSVHG